MHVRTGDAGRTRTPRRILTALLATLGLVLGLSSAPAHGVEPAYRGLFGSQNPTYDGTLRQSFALIGLAATKQRAPATAINWLVEQQCADGSFVSFRSDLAQPCPPADPDNYTGPDTNSTALAAMALALHGRKKASQRALAWLQRVQTPGGGWGFVEGSSPDTNSTGLALAAMRFTPSASRAAGAAVRWLKRQVLPCTAPPGERFGMTWQPGPDALVNGGATAQGLLGLTGAFPVREYAQRQATTKVTCTSAGRPSNATDAAARWLSSTIVANDGAIPDAYTPGQADLTATALAVVGLVKTRTAGRATQVALETLQEQADAYVTDGTADRPAALGILLLTAAATGIDPDDFGGIDLPRRLLATLQK